MDRTVEDIKEDIFGSKMRPHLDTKRKRDPIEAENSELKKELRELKKRVQELSSENSLLAQQVRELEAMTDRKPKKSWQDMLGL